MELLYKSDYLVGLVATIGVLFAYIEYLSNSTIRIREIIKTINAKLKVIGAWAGSEGDGYLGHPGDKDRFIYIRPFGFIYDIEYTSLEEVTYTTGTLKLTPRLHSRIYELNQNILRIKNIVEMKKAIVTNNYSLSVDLDKLINNYEKTHYIHDFMEFVKQNRNKKQISKLIQLFDSWGEEIHFQIIGSRNSNGMMQQHIEIRKGIAELEKEIDKPNIQLLILFILLILLIQLISLMILHSNSLLDIYYISVISYWLALIIHGCVINKYLNLLFCSIKNRTDS